MLTGISGPVNYHSFIIDADVTLRVDDGCGVRAADVLYHEAAGWTFVEPGEAAPTTMQKMAYCSSCELTFSRQ